MRLAGLGQRCLSPLQSLLKRPFVPASLPEQPLRLGIAWLLLQRLLQPADHLVQPPGLVRLRRLPMRLAEGSLLLRCLFSLLQQEGHSAGFSRVGFRPLRSFLQRSQCLRSPPRRQRSLSLCHQPPDVGQVLGCLLAALRRLVLGRQPQRLAKRFGRLNPALPAQQALSPGHAGLQQRLDHRLVSRPQLVCPLQRRHGLLVLPLRQRLLASSAQSLHLIPLLSSFIQPGPRFRRLRVQLQGLLAVADHLVPALLFPGVTGLGGEVSQLVASLARLFGLPHQHPKFVPQVSVCFSHLQRLGEEVLRLGELPLAKGLLSFLFQHRHPLPVLGLLAPGHRRGMVGEMLQDSFELLGCLGVALLLQQGLAGAQQRVQPQFLHGRALAETSEGLPSVQLGRAEVGRLLIQRLPDALKHLAQHLVLVLGVLLPGQGDGVPRLLGQCLREVLYSSVEILGLQGFPGPGQSTLVATLSLELSLGLLQPFVGDLPQVRVATSETVGHLEVLDRLGVVLPGQSCLSPAQFPLHIQPIAGLVLTPGRLTVEFVAGQGGLEVPQRRLVVAVLQYPLTRGDELVGLLKGLKLLLYGSQVGLDGCPVLRVQLQDLSQLRFGLLIGLAAARPGGLSEQPDRLPAQPLSPCSLGLQQSFLQQSPLFLNDFAHVHFQLQEWLGQGLFQTLDRLLRSSFRGGLREQVEGCFELAHLIMQAARAWVLGVHSQGRFALLQCLSVAPFPAKVQGLAERFAGLQ